MLGCVSGWVLLSLFSICLCLFSLALCAAVGLSKCHHGAELGGKLQFADGLEKNTSEPKCLLV